MHGSKDTINDEEMRMGITPEQQEQLFDKYVDDIDIVAIARRVEREAKRLARERLLAYVDKYGDRNFHKSIERIEREQLEEFADAINYEVFKRYRQENGLE